MYLGIEFDGDGRAKYVGNVAPELERLDRSPLKPQQKLYALRTCLVLQAYSRTCQSRETAKVGCRGPVHGPKVVAAS